MTQDSSSILEWYKRKDPKIFTLAGLAGTGKTTLIKSLLPHFKMPVVCAFTGKAVNVLARKGVPAQTIHSLIYDYDFKSRRWIKVDYLPYDIIIIDEASMVSVDLLRDLESFGTLILAVGDHGQLPPIGDDPGLMQKPDMVLEKIHRQAANSAIIRVAHKVRLGEFPVLAITQENAPEVRLTHLDALLEKPRAYNQILCAFNGQRNDINNAIRRIRGFTSHIHEGEKLICLRNDYFNHVFNGQMALVTAVRPTSVDLKLDDGRTLEHVSISKQTLETGTPPKFPEGSDQLHFTYGYAITVHKAQGSEWDKVAVVSGDLPYWDMPRWNYTAVTRAAKELVWI